MNKNNENHYNNYRGIAITRIISREDQKNIQDLNEEESKNFEDEEQCSFPADKSCSVVVSCLNKFLRAYLKLVIHLMFLDL